MSDKKSGSSERLILSTGVSQMSDRKVTICLDGDFYDFEVAAIVEKVRDKLIEHCNTPIQGISYECEITIPVGDRLAHSRVNNNYYTSSRTKHKPQPVHMCKVTSKICYKPNKIVQDFFLYSGLALEDIHLVGFLNNEYEHFLQLLGCPLDCMSDSSYFFNKTLSEIDKDYVNQWHSRHNEVVRYIYKKVVPNHCKWYAFSNYDDYTEENKAQFKQLVGDF